METSSWETSTKCTPGHARFCGPGDTTGTIVYAVSRALSMARRPSPKKWLTPQFCHHKEMSMLNLELETGGWGTWSKDAWFVCVQTCKLEREEPMADSWEGQIQQYLLVAMPLQNPSLPSCSQLGSLCMIFPKNFRKFWKARRYICVCATTTAITYKVAEI